MTIGMVTCLPLIFVFIASVPPARAFLRKFCCGKTSLFFGRNSGLSGTVLFLSFLLYTFFAGVRSKKRWKKRKKEKLASEVMIKMEDAIILKHGENKKTSEKEREKKWRGAFLGTKKKGKVLLR